MATYCIQAQQGPVHAVALARTADGCLAYCIGQTGTLKIFNAKTGSQVLALMQVMQSSTWPLLLLCISSAPCDAHIARPPRKVAASGGNALVQVRAAKLTDMPCTSMAVLPGPTGSTSLHPTVLCGSYDNKVLIPLSGKACALDPV